MAPQTSRSALHHLPSGQIHRLAAARGALIRVRTGVLWLTEPDCAEDRFISAGQTYRIRSRGLVLIESAGPGFGEFAVDPPSHPLVVRLAYRASRVVRPVHRLKARWKALGSEKPSK